MCLALRIMNDSLINHSHGKELCRRSTQLDHKMVESHFGSYAHLIYLVDDFSGCATTAVDCQ